MHGQADGNNVLAPEEFAVWLILRVAIREAGEGSAPG
jgi:hypothetical protein